MSKVKECLNLKNEWAGSKIPGISIVKPKGVMGVRRQGMGGDRGRDKDTETHTGDQTDTNRESRGEGTCVRERDGRMESERRGNKMIRERV